MGTVLDGTSFNQRRRTTMNTSMNKSVKMILAGMAIAALSANVYARGGDCDYGPGDG
jgi:hypothetical protein